MNNLVIKPTLKTLKLVAELEYLLGFCGEKTLEKADYYKKIPNFIPNLNLPGKIPDFEVTRTSLFELASAFGAKLRTEKLTFTDNHNRPVFTGVSPFIIDERLNDLLNWSKIELEKPEIHPLLICAIFHLVILHLQPFSTANHAIALITSSQILKHYACPSILLVDAFLNKIDTYYSTIRQAEKSCFADWSTINLWIEYFIECLLIAQQIFVAESNKAVKLNETQEKILSCIQNLGLCKREEITNKTGINIATVKYNLGVLTKLGCLKRTGEGRASSYSFLRKFN